MKIIVLSDTHIPKKAKKLPSRLIEELSDVDFIIHAGDWQTLETYEELQSYAPVEGVSGNVDSPEVQAKFGLQKILQFGDFKIGLVHGHGTHLTTEKRVIKTFKDDKLDMIIYGHSHIPILKTVDDMILFNPGSPTDKRRQKHYSFGIITITDSLKAEHIFFSDKD